MWELLKDNDALIALLSALIGGLISWVVSFHIYRIGEKNKIFERIANDKREEKDRLADYIEQMAGHLNRMADTFDERKIPHLDGRAFNGLYENIFSLFSSCLKEETKEQFRKLHYEMEKATRLDINLYNIPDNGPLPPETLNSMRVWSLDARRLCGDLMVAAAQIRNSDTINFQLTTLSKTNNL